MLNRAISNLRNLFRPAATTKPARFVYDPPWSDWTTVLGNLTRAEDAVLAYAKRTDLPAGVAGAMDAAAEQIRVGRRHDLTRLCRVSVTDPHYKPCCSHVADVLAAREPVTTES